MYSSGLVTKGCSGVKVVVVYPILGFVMVVMTVQTPATKPTLRVRHFRVTVKLTSGFIL